MKILAVAWNDMRRILRDRQALFWLLVGPVIFVCFFGLLLRDTGPGKPLLRLLDRDEAGYVARALTSVLEQDGIIVRAVESIQPGRLTLVVPEGATRRMAAGEQVELVLHARSDPGTAEQGLSFAIQRALVAIVLQAHPADVPHSLSAARIRQRLAANTVIRVVEQAGEGVAPEPPPTGFRHSVPAYLVMFLLMNLLASGADIAGERKDGQLRRMAMAPVPHYQIVLGKLAGRFAIGWILMLWLLGLGFVVFRMEWVEHPWALLGFLSLFAFAAAAAGLLIGTLFRDPDKAAAASIWAVILLSPLGGLWWPLEVVGPTLRRIGTLVPTGWAMQGLSAALNFGAGPLELAPWAAAFAVLGLVCLLLASRRLRPAG
jgi:ABC-2 type transport system permease protein